jgi:SWIM zinc finger
MTTTKTEALPATKTEPNAGIDWTPTGTGTGLLVIKQKRLYVTYTVTEFPTAWDGRAFHFEKFTEGSDRDSEAYDVFCSRNGQDQQCQCKGFTYGRGRPCKHIAAAQALIANGWI